MFIFDIKKTYILIWKLSSVLLLIWATILEDHWVGPYFFPLHVSIALLIWTCFRCGLFHSSVGEDSRQQIGCGSDMMWPPWSPNLTFYNQVALEHCERECFSTPSNRQWDAHRHCMCAWGGGRERESLSPVSWAGGGFWCWGSRYCGFLWIASLFFMQKGLLEAVFGNSLSLSVLSECLCCCCFTISLGMLPAWVLLLHHRSLHSSDPAVWYAPRQAGIWGCTLWDFSVLSCTMFLLAVFLQQNLFLITVSLSGKAVLWCLHKLPSFLPSSSSKCSYGMYS